MVLIGEARINFFDGSVILGGSRTDCRYLTSARECRHGNAVLISGPFDFSEFSCAARTESLANQVKRLMFKQFCGQLSTFIFVPRLPSISLNAVKSGNVI